MRVLAIASLTLAVLTACSTSKTPGAAANNAVDARVAAAQAEIDKAAAARIAAAQKEADDRVAAAAAAANKAADERIAAEKAAIDRAAEEKIAADRAAARAAAAEKELTERIRAEQSAERTVTKLEPKSPGTMVSSLRDADSLAQQGDAAGAGRIYHRVAVTPNASREILAAAASGLYRTGDYAGAAAAFKRLGTFARGEEDLRYYYAVSLYETGQYEQARKELACALPYIEVTDEVARYRTKIEQTAN
jgi:tetratricopeptide repeat protein